MSRSTLVTILTAICFYGLMAFGLLNNWMILAIGATLALFLIFGSQPLILLIAIPLVIPFGKIATLPIGSEWFYEITASELLIIATTGVVLLAAILHSRPKITPLPTLGIILIALWLWYALSFFWVQDFAKYLIAVRVSLFHVIIFLLAALIPKTFKDIENALWALPVLMLTIGVQLLLTLMNLTGFQSRLLYDRNLITTNVGALAFVLAIIVLIVPLTFVLRERLNNRWLISLNNLAIAMALIVSLIGLGKAAMICLIIGLLFVIIKEKQWLTLKWLVGSSAILLIIAFIIAPSIFQSLLNRWQHATTDYSTSFRIEEIQTGLTQFTRSPLTGVGAGNLKYYYKRYLRGYDGESNNILVQVAAEGGIIGLTLIFFIVITIIRLLRSPHLPKHLQTAFQSIVIVAFIHGMVEATFVGLEYGIVFWYAMGLLTATAKIKS